MRNRYMTSLVALVGLLAMGLLVSGCSRKAKAPSGGGDPGASGQVTEGMPPEGGGAKPGVKPGDKPGDQPATTPGVKPGDQPGDKPATTPGAKPGDQPAAPAKALFGDKVITAVRVAEAPGRSPKPREKRLTKAEEIQPFVALLKPGAVTPSGGKNKWLVELYAGKDLVQKIWVFDSGEWGAGGKSQGKDAALAKAIGDLLK